MRTCVFHVYLSFEITGTVLKTLLKNHLTQSNAAVVLEHFDQVVGDCFMDCVNCLIGFANNKSSHRISLKAIALLRICEDRLAEVHHKISTISTFILPPRARTHTHNYYEHLSCSSYMTYDMTMFWPF